MSTSDFDGSQILFNLAPKMLILKILKDDQEVYLK
jgi:hypothetical protein